MDFPPPPMNLDPFSTESIRMDALDKAAYSSWLDICAELQRQAVTDGGKTKTRKLRRMWEELLEFYIEKANVMNLANAQRRTASSVLEKFDKYTKESDDSGDEEEPPAKRDKRKEYEEKREKAKERLAMHASNQLPSFLPPSLPSSLPPSLPSPINFDDPFKDIGHNPLDTPRPPSVADSVDNPPDLDLFFADLL